jgi:hypothetical protein
MALPTHASAPVTSSRMATRIQVVVDEAEREAFRREAEREGLSLSAWLRELGRARVAAERPKIRTVDEFHAFLDRLPAREGDEPDWDEAKRIIEAGMVTDVEGS